MSDEWATGPGLLMWPELTRQQESRICMLLNQQQGNTLLFHAAARALLSTLGEACFPLGCPCPGYDIADLRQQLQDWLVPKTRQELEEKACELAQQ